MIDDFFMQQTKNVAFSKVTTNINYPKFDSEVEKSAFKAIVKINFNLKTSSFERKQIAIYEFVAS